MLDAAQHPDGEDEIGALREHPFDGVEHQRIDGNIVLDDVGQEQIGCLSDRLIGEVVALLPGVTFGPQSLDFLLGGVERHLEPDQFVGLRAGIIGQLLPVLLHRARHPRWLLHHAPPSVVVAELRRRRFGSSSGGVAPSMSRSDAIAIDGTG